MILKAQLARALHSSNLQQKEQHTAIDLVGAMGVTGINYSIAMASIHAIDALQPSSLKDLIYQLSRKAGKQIKCDKSILLKVCQQVIKEAAFNFCHTCSGRKEMVFDKKVIKCLACNGTGLHRHTDMQRAKALDMSLELYEKHWARILSIVQSIYTGECRNGMVQIKRKLEAV